MSTTQTATARYCVMRAPKELKFGETCMNREYFKAMHGFHAVWRKSDIAGADGKHVLEEFLQTQQFSAHCTRWPA